MTQERREYYRIPAFARVALRRLRPEEYDCARRRVRGLYVPPALGSGAADEAGLSLERRLELELLRRIAMTLDRIDRRLDDALTPPNVMTPSCVGAPEPMEIRISGSGFAGPIAIDVQPGELVEVDLDLWESGLPRIRAIAETVDADEPDPRIKAFRFEELHPEDQERIVRLTLRSQSQELREQRTEEAR